MARFTGLAILGLVGYAVVAQLLTAFVAPGSAGSNQLRRRVRLAASREAIAAAEKEAKLLVWAANYAAENGSPQAATMKAKADQAVATLNALKQQQGSAPVATPSFSAPAAAAPVAAAAPAMAAARAPRGASKEAIAAAEKEAKLLVWAANYALENGMPQAATMKAKADGALAALESLKQGSGAAVATPSFSAPVTSPPVAAAPVAPAVTAAPANKKALAEAKKEMDLAVWAANYAMENGAPTAAAMKAKADAKVQAYEAMNAQSMVSR